MHTLEKYKALTEREQKLVLVSAVLSIIALFYFAVWSPLNAALDKQKQLLNNQQSLLVWVKTVQQERSNCAAAAGVNEHSQARYRKR